LCACLATSHAESESESDGGHPLPVALPYTPSPYAPAPFTPAPYAAVPYSPVPFSPTPAPYGYTPSPTPYAPLLPKVAPAYGTLPPPPPPAYGLPPAYGPAPAPYGPPPAYGPPPPPHGPPACSIGNPRPWCLEDKEYPVYEIQHALEYHYDAVQQMYKDVLANTDNSVDRLNEIIQETYLCPTDTAYIQPQRAVNVNGDWRIVVNHVKAHYETLTQTARIEACTNPGAECPLVPECYESKCLQKSIYHRYLTRKLVA